MTEIDYTVKMTAEVPNSLVVDGIEGFLDEWYNLDDHHLEYSGYKEGDYAWSIDVLLDDNGKCAVRSYIDGDPYDSLYDIDIADLMTRLPEVANELNDYIQNGFEE